MGAMKAIFTDLQEKDRQINSLRGELEHQKKINVQLTRQLSEMVKVSSSLATQLSIVGVSEEYQEIMIRAHHEEEIAKELLDITKY